MRQEVAHLVVVRDPVHLRPGLAVLAVSDRLLDHEDEAGGSGGRDCHRHLLRLGLRRGLGPVVARGQT